MPTPGFDLFDCDAALGRRHGATALEPHSKADLLASMDRCGIRRALVAHHSAWFSEVNLGNRLLTEETAASDRLVGCWTAVPDDAGDTERIPRVLQNMLAAGGRAVRLMPKTMLWNLAEWCSGKLCTSLQERQIPALIPLEETSFDALHGVLTHHPQLRVMLLQLSYRIDRELYPFALAHPNLYLSMSPRYSSHDGIERLRDQIGPERLLFGTRWPESEPGAGVSFTLYARIPDSDKRLIAGANLDRLLAEVLA
ncbi:MAG TPA: amidohydrolase family protein [Planctomycetota bacterium]|nr:amidohydrolase family protein [Planctomycetota bacterium]